MALIIQSARLLTNYITIISFLYLKIKNLLNIYMLWFININNYINNGKKSINVSIQSYPTFTTILKKYR
jgi:hypothetical protein